MNKQLEALIASEIADFFAGVVEIHTELGWPNTVEEAQQQITERVNRIASECEAALIAALVQSQTERDKFKFAFTEWLEKTEWVQKADVGRFSFTPFGMHRADILSRHVNNLEAALEQAQSQSSKWLEAYHKAASIGARYEERIAELEAIKACLLSALENHENFWALREMELSSLSPEAAMVRDVGQRAIAKANAAPSPMKASPLAVKLPAELIDEVCLAAAEIHNRGNGVDDDKAQFIIDRIRNFLENGGQVEGE